MGKRTTEFVLGLLGGIFGFVTGFFGAFISIFTDITGVGWIFFFSIVGIAGSIVVKSKAKVGGALMLISGLVIVYQSSLFGLLPMVLLVIGGLMGLIKKDKKK